MALLSTKGIYGLMAIEKIAEASEFSPISIQSISDKIGVSKGYLEQILNDLRNAEVIAGIKGKNGGYFLSKNPDEISFLDVFLAVEKDFGVAKFDSDHPSIKLFLDEANHGLNELFSRPISELKKFDKKAKEYLNFSI
ncbi:MAG: Rrf2 family transcriptional regulator [Campylobacter sp.]|nr:Rrf2 family transcriptional regulator [Campylobacter sp.]